MPEKRQRSLADPSLLSPRDEDDKKLFKVVVETPRAVATNMPSILTIECSNWRRYCRREWLFLTTSDFCPLRKVETEIHSTF